MSLELDSRRPDGNRAENDRKSGFISPDAPTDADLYKCVHCGFCLQACPTYLETGLEAESPRGRIALMKAVRENRLGLNEQTISHWDLCLACRACEVACPSGVPYGRLIEATRAELKARYKRPVVERAGRALGYRTLLADPAKMRLAGKALRLYQRSGMRVLAQGSGLLKILPGGLGQLDRGMPRINDRFFEARGQMIPAEGPKRARVAMLAGCVMTMVHAPALEATTRVLARNGVEIVLTADQGCCGALNAHAGERESAREMARRNIDSFLSAAPDAVIVASAGCGSTMKEYEELLHRDPAYQEKAARVSKLTRDIHEFLAALPFIPPTAAPAGVMASSAEADGRPLRVTYQDACHLASAQRIKEAPRQILKAIPGVELVEMPEAAVCCGSAGTYSITEKEMSARLGRRKAANVASTRADLVLTGNPGCAIQMTTFLQQLRADGVRVVPGVRYVMELLDAAYAAEKTRTGTMPSPGQQPPHG